MNKLQELRKERMLSQKELSELSGVSARTIKALEQGYRDINKTSTTNLLRLAKTIGCSMEDLRKTEDTISDLDNRIVADAVRTEMSESCHNDYIEDYDNPLDFYKSNAEADSYIGYLQETYRVGEEHAILKEIERRA